MTKRFLFIGFILFALVGCRPEKNAKTPITQKLHRNWSFQQEGDTLWKSASVPGNVFTDLLNHELIEDPFILNNEEKVQWVSDSQWIYRSTFSVDKKQRLKKYHKLTFEGLDTYAKVYLNDTLILETNNAFRTYQVDVSKSILEENRLQIEFTPTREYEELEKQKLDYELPEGNRVFTRKAQFQYGWDWGPKLNTSGIWKDISLTSWDDLIVEDVFIAQGMITETDADLDVQVTLKSDVEKTITLSATTEEFTFQKEIQLAKGTYDYSIPISIKNPKLWWPHHLGKPHLYDFTIQLLDKKILLEEKKLKHGIRTVQLYAQPDSIGQSFYFKVNNVPVYMKGANYIPQHSFQKKVTQKDYEKLLSDVVDANMNMLRVWGGGIYENDLFYELCDEKGILVWQDFMFACAMYPGDDNFLRNVQLEAFDQVMRLRNHASIALWCGNNENSEGWHRWGWQNGKTEAQKKEIWNNYLKVFDSILPYTVDRLTDVNYWQTSPKYGRGNPKYKTEGDAHDWWVWHDGYPFEHFEENVPRFMSEFGFQSFPSEEVINYINQLDTLNLQTDAIKSHQKHARGFQLIDAYMKREYPETHSDLDRLYVSQLTQAKGITMGIEAHRRARPYNMGSLFWQLNDCWPAISWSSIDYFGNWKALHYKARESFDDLLISTTLKDNLVTTFIVNDHLQSMTDVLSLKILDFQGNELWSLEQEVTAKANSSSEIFQFSLEEMIVNPAEVVLVSSFQDKISTFYFKKPKELLLPDVDLTKFEVVRHDGRYQVTLSSSVLLKDVFLSTNVKGHFDENFFDLLPNQEKILYFSSYSEEEPQITIRTLNQIIEIDHTKKQVYKTDSK
jgi:beta-mannosidase